MSTQWEVRTTGNNANGGGFVIGATGTDYSQQDAAQYSFTDLVVDGTLNTKVTSASHTFVAADVGNYMDIAGGGGWTNRKYEIVSVSAGAAILNVSPAATGTTGGVFSVGGALAALDAMMGIANFALTTYGDIIWVKAGTYTVTTSILISPANNSATYSFVGYNTTRGDTPTGNNRPLITTATNSVNLITLNATSSGGNWRNMRFTNTAGTPGQCFRNDAGTGPADVLFDNLDIGGFTYGFYGKFSDRWAWQTVSIRRCVIHDCTQDAIINTGPINMFACYIKNNGGRGYYRDGTQYRGFSEIECCVFYNNTGPHIQGDGGLDGAMMVINNDFVDGGSDAIKITTNPVLGGWVINNNIIDGNAGIGVNITTGSATVNDPLLNCDYNAYRANGGGNFANLSAGAHDVAPSTDPFVDRTNNDFNLNSTAGGNACKNSGISGQGLFG